MLRHGYAPNGLLLGTMVPIPKLKGTNKSDNYRAITISSLFGKLLVIMILSHLSTSNLQFGFKKGCSTDTCSFTVQEIINHYSEYGSDVHCILLDATKAFDRLEFCTLFKKLILRNICPVVIRLLLFMYTSQSLIV